MPVLTKIMLTDFRNYRHQQWCFNDEVHVFYGENGSGKTNFLEALSMLIPGRGLRGQQAELLVRHGAEFWGIAGRFHHNNIGQFDLGTAFDMREDNRRRRFHLNGQPIRKQTDILDLMTIVWLIPLMDRIFYDGPSARRRFLDRLVVAYHPGHGAEMVAFERAAVQRNRLLSQGRIDRGWLNGLESSMARHAVAISAARMSFIKNLNRSGFDEEIDLPIPLLETDCRIIKWLEQYSALQVEDKLREQLQANRQADALLRGSSIGSHRMDYRLIDARSGQDMSYASSGQQSSMLVSLVLLHGILLKQMRQDLPLILLDEPLNHLDYHHQQELFKILLNYNLPAFMTGTDKGLFASLKGKAKFIGIKDGVFCE